MTMTRLPGGLWAPTLFPRFYGGSLNNMRDDGLLDADGEELQFIGTVCLAAGSGSKTFGTSGSTIYWRAGAAITFASGSTLRVGIKSSLDAANGPPGRATAGAAAFNVYKDLVGGTNTISSSAWDETPMASGTPFSVTHGDNIAISFHLSVSSGTPSVKITADDPIATLGYPFANLITAGPTYTSMRDSIPIIIIKFDDGTIGWIDGSYIYTTTAIQTVGNTNIYGNLITPAYTIKVDAIAAVINSSGTTNFDVGFWTDPSGTPTKMTNGNLSIGPQYVSAASTAKSHIWTLPAEITLNAGTSYLLGVGQNSASAIIIPTYDVNAATHFQANGMDGDKCYAVQSTAGASVVSQNSGKRRAAIYMRISQIDNGAGGGTTIAGTPMLRGMI